MENNNPNVDVEKTETKETQVDSQKDAEITKLKEMLSKANSEAAGYKKQLKEKMSAEELAKDKEKEEKEALMNELNELKKDKQVASYKTKFMGLGFDEETAQKQAEALFGGDTDSLFNNFKGFTETVRNNAMNQALNDNKKLTDGDKEVKATEITKEQFKKMGYNERLKLLQEKPEVYNKLVG